MADQKTMGLNHRYYALHHFLLDATIPGKRSVSRINDVLKRVITDPENVPMQDATFLQTVGNELKKDGLLNAKYDKILSGTPAQIRDSVKDSFVKHGQNYSRIVRGGGSTEALQYLSVFDQRPGVGEYVRDVTRGLKGPDYFGNVRDYRNPANDHVMPYQDILVGANVDITKLGDEKPYPKMVVSPNHVLKQQDNFGKYTDNQQILVTPFMDIPDIEAKRRQNYIDRATAYLSDGNHAKGLAEFRKHISNRKLSPMKSNIYSERRDVITDVSALNEIATTFSDIPTMTEPDNDGKQYPLKGYQQLETVLGDYLSDNDLKALRNVVDDNQQISPYELGKARDVLASLYDSGADFTLNPRKNVRDGKFSIRADISSSNANRMQVTVLDDDAKYIGRVYDSHGAYYLNPNEFIGKTKFAAYTDKDITTAPLDYIMQKRQGTIELNKGFDGFRNAREDAKVHSLSLNHPSDMQSLNMYDLPMSYRSFETKSDLNSVHPDTPEAANEQLRKLIATSRNQFIRKAIGPDLTNVDNVLSDYQGQLRSFMKENNVDSDKVLGMLNELPMSTSLRVNDAIFAARSDVNEDDLAQARLVADKVNELTDEGVGTFQDGFHPSNVINMSKEVTNGRTQEQVIASLMKSGYDLDKLKQDDTTKRFMEAMISYRGKSKQITTLKDTDDTPNPNESTETNPFKREMMQLTADTLKNAGVTGSVYDVQARKNKPQPGTNPDVSMDDQGIIHWTGFRYFEDAKTNKKSYRQISGDIGQIFAPDEHGIAHIQLNGNDNYDYVPGMNGYFKYEGMSDGKDYMSRLRAEGYEQLMRREVFNTLDVQLQRPYRGSNDMTFASDVTALNKIYHGEAYGTRLEEGWFDDPKTDEAMGTETKEAIVANLQRRMHLPNKLRDNATTFSESSDDSVDTKVNGVSQLVDAHNLRILPEDYVGYFDMTMTGTNKTQGMVLYLAKGAKVETDGSITPADLDHAREMQDSTLVKAPVRGLDYFKYQGYNAWDRNQMSSNQILTNNGVDQSRTALMTMGGWTYDDSAVISTDFAERNMVKGEDGEYRPLMKGDKLSDFGGNKATIGLVVDRNMDPKQAKAEGIEKEVAIFNQNPELDTVMSPYSVITRDNTGVVHELMDNDPQPVMFTDPDTGETSRIGDSGKLNLIVTDMLADSKTHAYSEEDIADGKGRKLSSQYVWALNQHGANKIVQTAFNKNERQWSSLREYLLVTGYDMAPDGTLSKLENGTKFDKETGAVVSGASVHETEERKSYYPSEDVDSEEFIRQLGNAGGNMELPFEVQLASGTKTKTLPIMSAALRYNTEFMDGSTKVNDYTKNYAAIYDSIVKYQHNAKTLADMKDLKSHPEDFKTNGKQTLDQKIASVDRLVNNSKEMVQRQVSSFSDSIVNDKLGGYNGEYSKHSFIRDHLMGIRMENSATAIATADPRLSVNDVAISEDVAKSLNVQDGDYALVNRDPCLHAGSIRAMKVNIDKSIQGIALSPTADKSFDGDFDGDTYGLITMPEFKTDPEIKKELEKMEVKNNLLDPGAPNPTSYLNISMDVVSGSVPAGTTDYVSPYDDAKAYEEMDKAGRLPVAQLNDKLTNIALKNNPDVALAETDHIIKQSINSKNYGAAHIDLMERDGRDARENMERSIREMTHTGAKGSPKKVVEYMKYFDGMSGDEKVKADNEIQRASGYKSDLTGVAGSYSQRLIALTRDIDPHVALEVTYKATQGTLQIKHDAEKAKVVREVLTHDLRNLFNGQHVDDSNEGALSKKAFVNEFEDVYTNKLEVNVSREQLESLADTLSNGGNTIQPVSDLMKVKASPLDQVAYGGGLSAIDELASKHKSFVEGKHSSLMAPDRMKNGEGKDILLRHDTQEVDMSKDITAAMNKVMDPVYDKVLKDGKVVRNNFAPITEEPEETKRPKPKTLEEKKEIIKDSGLEF